MERLAARRRQMMGLKIFNTSDRPSETQNGVSAIKMGSQPLKRPNSLFTSLRKSSRTHIQTSPITFKEKPIFCSTECNKSASEDLDTDFICDDLRRISKSLDCLKNNLTSQHREIIRDVESNIKNVNNGIISDIDRIRENLHSLEYLVSKQSSDDSGLREFQSDDGLDSFTVTSEESLVSTPMVSPSSTISTFESLRNYSSPGSKSHDSGIFFDESKSSLLNTSALIQLGVVTPRNLWRASTGSNILDKWTNDQYDWLWGRSCNDMSSTDGCIENPVHQRNETAISPKSDKPCQELKANFQEAFEPERSHDGKKRRTWYDGQGEMDEHGICEDDFCSPEDLSLEEPEDSLTASMCTERSQIRYYCTERGTEYNPADDTCSLAKGTCAKVETVNSNVAYYRIYDWSFFSEESLFDWRWKISGVLWREWLYPCLSLSFDERLQIKINGPDGHSYPIFYNLPMFNVADLSLYVSYQVQMDIAIQDLQYMRQSLQSRKKNQNFREDMVRSHNAFREYHGCQDLVEADDLTRDAQMWADIIAEKSFLQYSELPGRGENVVFLDTNGKSISASDVTKLWYEQKTNYDFSTPRWRKDTMNFTQLIWKSTSELGVGIAKIKGQDRCAVVTQYRPAGNGNMPGEFRKNVLPPQ